MAATKEDNSNQMLPEGVSSYRQKAQVAYKSGVFCEPLYRTILYALIDAYEIVMSMCTFQKPKTGLNV